MDLTGRAALVTGGGRGAGRACALGLARAGADVAVAARSTPELEAVAAEIRALGRRALALPCDVADPAQVETTVARARAELGPPTILVAAAGVGESRKFTDTTDDLWDRHLRVNASGVFYAARAAVPHMLDAGWGRIVVIASTASRVPVRYTTAYTASKHAALGLVRSLALELAQRGITTNAICPGFLDTQMTIETVANIVKRTGRTPEEARKTLEGTSPQGRIFDASEVAAVAVFLCSEAARGINGQGIVLDGGGAMP